MQIKSSGKNTIFLRMCQKISNFASFFIYVSFIDYGKRKNTYR